MEEIELFDFCVKVGRGFKDGMKTSAVVYVDEGLRRPLFEELESGKSPSSFGQISNVCSLPGLVGEVVGLPDIHTGYGFPIGSVAAFDVNNPESVLCPGGVGYDINCGVRALRVNIDIGEFREKAETLADELFDIIPTGIGAHKKLKIKMDVLDSVLDRGLDYLLKCKEISEDDLEYCESRGHMSGDHRFVSSGPKRRGMCQLGSLGSGNHYLEVQYVDEIYDEERAKVLGVKENQIIVMIHSGSRGLGHGVCSDSLSKMSKKKGSYGDQLICSAYNSEEAREYLASMNSAANFAFVNRAMITNRARKAFAKVFKRSELELIYDVCHNIAKHEKHRVDGVEYETVVHRKGASRAFPPYHEDIPWKYKEIGQPVIVGGSMGTFSYVLCGSEMSMDLSFGSACHGAGRLLSRKKSKDSFTKTEVCDLLRSKGIVFRCESELGMVEESPNSYKDVNAVVELCEKIGLAKRVFRVKPCLVIKG